MYLVSCILKWNNNKQYYEVNVQGVNNNIVALNKVVRVDSRGL